MYFFVVKVLWDHKSRMAELKKNNKKKNPNLKFAYALTAVMFRSLLLFPE